MKSDTPGQKVRESPTTALPRSSNTQRQQGSVGQEYVDSFSLLQLLEVMETHPLSRM